MRIGFDARLINETGVGRYIKNLLDELKEIDINNEYFIFLPDSEFKKFSIPNSNWHKILLEIGWHTLKEQLFMPFTLNKFKLDLVHFPYFNVPLFYSGKYVITVHDLIIDHFNTGRASTMPHLFYSIKRLGYKILMKNSLNRASFIFSISNTTKSEIIDHYQINPHKIIVTYDALDNSFKTVKLKYKPRRIIDNEYLLYVGNAYPHKNLETLCLCFKEKSIHSQVKLVLAGDDWFFYPRLKKFVEQNKLENHIIFTGIADNRKLFNLYAFARALLIPSLMEGFGLPNLEAIYLGVLPIVSDIPVFKEIWKNDLLYYNPADINDIKKTLLRFLSLNPKVIKNMRDKALLRIPNYSWRKTAIDTLKIYNSL